MNSLEYLLAFQRFGIKLGLENITHLLERVGNPHTAFPSVHITGTNGKGSVTAFISCVLEKMGFTVGRFISPHLMDFSERIVVNNVPIARSEIDALVAEIRPVVDEMQAKVGLSHPTFFEAVTAMAFKYFACRHVDFAVVEVGMGGRFDSTNVVQSCLSIITNVHLEHREYLGDTIEKIAVEKAGIIKPGVEVVSAVDEAEAKAVIHAKARETGSAIYCLGDHFQSSTRRGVFPKQYITYRGPWNDYDDVEINLGGDFQAANAGVAIMGLEILQKKNLIPSDELALRAGMAETNWPARLQQISESPLVLLDGAHNPSAIRVLVDSVHGLFPGRRIILVIAMLSDKDVHESLRILSELGNTIVVTQSTYERALAAEKLLNVAQGIFPHPYCEQRIPAALGKAISLAGPTDIILVAGSLFNVAEVKGYFSARDCSQATPQV